MASKKLVVTSYSSDPFHPGLIQLYMSLAKWGWPRLRLWSGEDQFPGFLHKIVVAAAQIPILRNDGVTHMIVTDAWDSVCLGPMAEIGHLLPDYGAIVSCERACYPYPEKATLYPAEQQHSDWKHVNGGCFLTELRYFEEVLMPFFRGHNYNEDQSFFTDAILARLPGMGMDSKCEIWQCIAHCEFDRDFEFLPNGRFRNKQTGTTPIFAHGNGRTSMTRFTGQKDWWE